MLLVPIPWSSRVWALPFLSSLAPSERYAKVQRKRHHKPITEWSFQLLMLVRRWHPEREIVAVADGGYASLKLLDRCRKLKKPITFITRLRLDAALYEPAPPRKPHQKGRPRLKGARLPNLSAVAEDWATLWTPTTVTNWYGSAQRTVEIVSDSALWYSTGLPAVPLRWVLIRDPDEEFETQALLCTDLDASPQQIISWFVRRWQMEATFQEIRQRLGFETQRHWSEKAIRRTAPALFWACSPWSLSWPTTRWLITRTWTPSAERPGTTSFVRPSPTLWRWCAKSYGPPRALLFAGRRRKPTW
jgi:hypothetical protein